jgi:hypothetical protein
LASDQKVRLTPALSRLDEALIRSTLGVRPDEIHYEWRSLWQMSDTEKADINLKIAQAHNVDVMAGLINPMVLKQARENFLIENGFMYPGLEAAQDELEPPEWGENVHEAEMVQLERTIDPPMPGEPGGPPLPTGPPNGGNGPPKPNGNGRG